MSDQREIITLDTPLAGKLTLRTANALENLGILYIRDLEGVTREDLLSSRNFGITRLNEVIRLLKRYQEQERQRRG